MRALGRARVECRHAIRGWISDEERNAGEEAQGEDGEVLTKVLTRPTPTSGNPMK